MTFCHVQTGLAQYVWTETAWLLPRCWLADCWLMDGCCLAGCWLAWLAAGWLVAACWLLASIEKHFSCVIFLDKNRLESNGLGSYILSQTCSHMTKCQQITNSVSLTNETSNYFHSIGCPLPRVKHWLKTDSHVFKVRKASCLILFGRECEGGLLTNSYYYFNHDPIWHSNDSFQDTYSCILWLQIKAHVFAPFSCSSELNR